MEDNILVGRNQRILEISQTMWKQHLAQAPQHFQARLSFMTDAHRQIRYFVVRELVNRQKPVEPESIAEILNIPLAQVRAILDDLERKLFFLVRDEFGSVSWAYPVTVEVTPHRLIFNTGERLYAA